MTRSNRPVLILGVLLVGVALVLLLNSIRVRSPHALSRIPRVNFRGLTNGGVGPLAATYGTLSSNHAGFVQQWLAQGTNSAQFSVINLQDCAIDLFPIVRLETTGIGKTNRESFLQNAPTFSGIRLKPGEVAAVCVAVLPLDSSSRVTLYFSRESSGDPWFVRLTRLSEWRALFTGNVVVQTRPVSSDWFEPGVLGAAPR